MLTPNEASKDSLKNALQQVEMELQDFMSKQKRKSNTSSKAADLMIMSNTDRLLLDYKNIEFENAKLVTTIKQQEEKIKVYIKV